MNIPGYLLSAVITFAFIQMLRWTPLLDIQTRAGDEVFDKVVFSCLLAGSVIGGIKLRSRKRERFLTLAKAGAYLGLCILAYGIVSLDVVEGMDTSSLWMGFGGKVLILASVLAIAIAVAGTKGKAGAMARLDRFLDFLGIGTFLYYSIATLQLPFSIRDTYHSRFIFNEAAGLWLGKRPLEEIVNQYSNIFGYVPRLFKVVAGDSVQVFLWSSCISLWVGATLTVLLLVWTARRCLTEGYKWIAWFAIVPCILTKGENNLGWDGSISIIYSALPIRLFFFSLGGAILSTASRKNTTSRKDYAYSSIVGFVAGLSIVNNLEFGLATSMALLFTWGADLTCRKSVKESISCFTAALTTLPIAPILFTSGLSIKEVERWGSYVLSFGKGFGSSEISQSGPQYIVLPVLFASLGYSIWVYRASLAKCTINLTSHRDRLRRTVLCYSSLFGVLGMPYYLNRSIASAQLQIFLAPFALCSLILAAIYLKSIQPSRETEDRENDTFLFTLVAVLPVASCVGCIANAPILATEIQRTLGNQGYIAVVREMIRGQLVMPEQSILPEPPPRALIEKARGFLSNGQIPIATSFGNLIEAQNKSLKSIVPINTTDDFVISGRLREVACVNTDSKSSPYKVIILSSELMSLCKAGSVNAYTKDWGLVVRGIGTTPRGNGHNITNIYRDTYATKTKDL